MDVREQQKKLSALEMELVAAKQEGFTSNHWSKTNKIPKKRPLVVIGVLTTFGRKNNRDAIRKAWMGTGAALKKMEDKKGIIVRFIIGRSANGGDSLDRDIDNENKQTNDFSILENHVEAPEELPKKTKLFFAHAAENWDAEFYAKVNDDVYVNIDALGNSLAAHLDKPRVYVGCMKSGEVFSEQSHKWYEPDWWKFGDGKVYFRHASDLFFKLTPMMMLLWDLGLLGSMSNILMREHFAARLGHQELSVQVYDVTSLKNKNNTTNASATDVLEDFLMRIF
ncbi:hypothetical protein TEA_023262 [Camellia sinensis var. sinensis]|uniref:Hexosyltransferase n=1 Tax=Camellia sinensis var. sinensis TaxID=542762 RepID=A0A4S4DSD0_CAMSN|nr:hypothetical protein TEA_023262 [Camellia sinensis var. sinensis]